MTDQGPRHAALTRRFSLVAEVSGLNAQALKLTQALAGIEMEILRIELDMGKSPSSAQSVQEQLVQDLHEARDKARTIQASQAECEERIAATEQRIEEIDRLLAGMT